jgi:ketosteroid isomerase-like protein
MSGAAGYCRSVSTTPVEVIRSIYEAWRDGRSARGFMDPEIEYVNPPDAIEPGTRTGPDTFARFRDAYDLSRIETHEFIETGNDVVVLATVYASGRASGIPVEWNQGYIWTVRDGKAVRFRWFNTHAEALKAAGVDR